MDVVVHETPPRFPGETQSGTTITLAMKTPSVYAPDLGKPVSYWAGLFGWPIRAQGCRPLLFRLARFPD